MARTKTPLGKIVKQIKKRSKKNKQTTHDHLDNLILLPTPSTMMNLACSDTHDGALSVGRMINLIGDSSTGKTLFGLTCFSEANMTKDFDEYRFIFDDVENANTFNMGYMFGKQTAKRIEPPAYYEDGTDKPSWTIEDFHCNIADALDDGRPFIYILDSFDALDAEGDIEKVEEMRAKRKKGEKAKGTYAMAKPKKASQLFRNITTRLKQTNSILIVISQTRDNIDAFSFQKRTRSGGRALKFYAHHEIWLAMGKKIKSKGEVIGANVLAVISKNKLTGKHREVTFPIYYDMGVDNIRSTIDFLVAQKHWKKTKNTIDAKDLKIKGGVAKLINFVELKNKEKKLERLAAKAWDNKEKGLRLNRKRKYA